MQINTYRDAITLLEKYPFFTFAAIRAAELTDDPAEKSRLRLIADLQLSSVSEPEVTRDPEEKKDMPDAIDAFLKNYNLDAPLPYTPAETEITEEDLTSAIDDEDLLPDLVKNRKYSEALAIIEQLNLKNPEKSIYFADQIRFLKKLILNQAKANRK